MVVLVLLLPRHLLKVDYTGLTLLFWMWWVKQPSATLIIALDNVSMLTRPGTTTRLPKALERLYVRFSPTAVFMMAT